MEKHHIVKRIIALLNEYFQDDRAYSLSLFFWHKSVENTSCSDSSKPNTATKAIALEIKFHFELLNQGSLTSGSKEAIIFNDKKLMPQFMHCPTTHGLAKKIQKRLSKIFLHNHSDESIFLNFFTGITFYKNDWKEKISKVFLGNDIESFFSIENYKRLSKKLPLTHRAFEKRLKI